MVSIDFVIHLPSANLWLAGKIQLDLLSYKPPSGKQVDFLDGNFVASYCISPNSWCSWCSCHSVMSVMPSSSSFLALHCFTGNSSCMACLNSMILHATVRWLDVVDCSSKGQFIQFIPSSEVPSGDLQMKNGDVQQLCSITRG